MAVTQESIFRLRRRGREREREGGESLSYGTTLILAASKTFFLVFSRRKDEETFHDEWINQ